MKKLILSALVCAVLMTSCKSAAAQPGAVFEYQKNLGTVSGIWSENGEEYEIALSFEGTEDGSVLRTVTFISPETLKGISIDDRGDHVDMSVDGMCIDMEFADKTTMLRAASLFSLDTEDITDITADENKTVISGKSENAVWQVETDSEGAPEKIIYESKDMSCVFTVTAIN